MKEKTGRLITVSNRLPVSIKKAVGGLRAERSSGGLATALDSAWRQQPGIWIGWAGTTQDHQISPLLTRAVANRPYTLTPVTLSAEEVAKFYSGFANEIIWPLFHDMPSRCNFDPDYWEIYQRVNRKFADAVAAIAREDDFVWIHDYHLMLTAHFLRASGLRSRLGFFLHIPFPAPDLFQKLPWGEPILRDLLNFNLVGFQTDRDRINFQNCLHRFLPNARLEVASPFTKVVLDGKTATLGAFPISIAFDEFSDHAARPEIASRASSLRRDLMENFLVLGVDRLDYTKGIPERLKAFRILLRKYPELRGQITLVQVVVPSREDIPRYNDLRRDLELLVSRINGEFTKPGWVPIHYMHRNLRREELLAYYRAADIALITPLKDGMNLVAKEFCAAQVDERGVLLVSEFAGASQELRQGALVVNPNDYAAVADAIHEACVMPAEDKRNRMRLLRGVIQSHNVNRWAQSFLQAVESIEITREEVRQESAGNKGDSGSDQLPGTALVAAGPGNGAGLAVSKAANQSSRERNAASADMRLSIL
jgi:alpha,alpha-trehalose-phosphate synthase [UDP-forming]